MCAPDKVTGVLKDLPHRRGGHFHPQEQQLTMNTPVSPVGVLSGQTQHHDADATHSRWPAVSAWTSWRAAVRSGRGAGTHVRKASRWRAGTGDRQQTTKTQKKKRQHTKKDPRVRGS